MVPDERFGRALLLRDNEGVTSAVAVVPAPLVPIVARFTGGLTVAQIADQVARESGASVPVELVQNLADELERALLLDSPRYREARRRVESAFANADVRPASHAGGAYHAEPTKLRRYLDDECLAKGGAPADARPLVGLVAPHIDPWRGAVGYGHAYGALRRSVPADADTFVLLGTSHAPMREPFALCRKAFDTPLGPVEADLGAIDAIAEAAAFDPYADLFNHKREHSIEFQAVFLKHLLGDRPIRIIPILCGLGEQQREGSDPERDARTDGFVRAVKAVCERRRAVVVAGADLAHVGPRFGDPEPYDEAARTVLAKADRDSLERATAVEARAFFEHVQRDLHTRRVCGLGPIYTLLRLLPTGSRGDVLHYEQTIDLEEGSIVSHAAVGFYG